jgi:predicted Zn-dependent protease
MKRKFFLHLTLFILVLFGLWFVISQLDFKEILNTEKRIEQMEEKLGRWTFRYFQAEYEQLADKKTDSLTAVITHDLLKKNYLLDKEIQISFFKSKEINAFAIPGNKIIIFSELIDFTETEEEFLGIIAHEIAHIEKNHVSKKISKEIGISTLYALFFSSFNNEIIKEIAKTITSTAYDRSMEKEADIMALSYLIEANIDPMGYVNLLKRLSKEIENMPKELRLLSTHPDSFERAMLLQELLDNKNLPTFNQRNTESWKELKEMMSYY